MKLDKHGIKMAGLKKIASNSKSLNGYYSGLYLEVFYDRKTGEAWSVEQYSLGHNTWTEYHDSNVIKIGIISVPTTMQEIADLISEKLKEQKYNDWYKLAHEPSESEIKIYEDWYKRGAER